jgi:hypothetical protein
MLVHTRSLGLRVSLRRLSDTRSHGMLVGSKLTVLGSIQGVGGSLVTGDSSMLAGSRAVHAQAAANTLTITKPDDWHLHVRDGAAMRSVVHHTAQHFARAIIMPNLVPAVTTAQAVSCPYCAAWVILAVCLLPVYESDILICKHSHHPTGALLAAV